MILIHELGHFTAAKLLDVKVNEFALGMGPKLFSKKIGETLYSIRLFLIGGFVKMEGEDGDSEDERAFYKKKAWKRMIIVVAGAVMNVILGLVLFVTISSMGRYILTTTVSHFTEEATTNVAGGLQVNDKILEVNGLKILSYDDISFGLSRGSADNATFKVLRNGETLVLTGIKLSSHEYQGQTYAVQDFYTYGREKTVLNVLGDGVMSAVSVTRQIWISLIDLFTGKVSVKMMSGIVGVGTVISESVVNSESLKLFLYKLFFLGGLLSVNLGVVNMLPLPALDGGRAFFILVEMITRKKLKPEHEGFVHFIGFALLMILTVFITYNDIIKLFS